jgi:hypothetical protein
MSNQKTKDMQRGIMMFAHNNTEIDYIRMACVNSLLAQHHLGLKPVQVTIVTDSYSYDHAEKTFGKRYLKKASGNWIIQEKDVEFKRKNQRAYRDTVHNVQQLSFYNLDRADAYDLSPYTETILIDADYLILSDTLNHCWQHNNDLMMNWRWQDIQSDRKFAGLDRISDLGITHYWATVVYFEKTPYAENFFALCKHVRENAEYYRDLYRWPGSLYRNDYSFSIAAHMMSGFTDKGIPQLPFPLYKTFDLDDIYQATGVNSIVMFLEKANCPGDFVMCHWRDLDLHVMNKWAINRIASDLEHHLDQTT